MIIEDKEKTEGQNIGLILHVILHTFLQEVLNEEINSKYIMGAMIQFKNK